MQVTIRSARPSIKGVFSADLCRLCEQTASCDHLFAAYGFTRSDDDKLMTFSKCIVHSTAPSRHAYDQRWLPWAAKRPSPSTLVRSIALDTSRVFDLLQKSPKSSKRALSAVT